MKPRVWPGCCDLPTSGHNAKDQLLGSGLTTQNELTELAGGLVCAFMAVAGAYATRERAKGTSSELAAKGLQLSLVALLADIFSSRDGSPERMLQTFSDQVIMAIYVKRVVK